MSKFSRQLREVVDEKDIKIYSLAKKIDCDRSLLQKVISGERKLGFDKFTLLFEELKNYLEADELKRLYENFSSDYFGEDYELIVFVKNRIKQMSEFECYINNTNFDILNISQYNDCEEYINEKNKVIEKFIKDFRLNDNEKNIVNKVAEIFCREFIYSIQNDVMPKLYLYIPDNLAFVKNLIIVLLKNSNLKGRIDLKFVIECISENSDKSLMGKFLTACEFASYGYNTYFEEYETYTRKNSILPYYIITSNNSLMISEDCEIVLLNSDYSQVSKMLERFEKIISNKEYFFESLECNEFNHWMLKNRMNIDTCEDICCNLNVFMFCTREILEEIIDKDYEEREDLINRLVEVFENVKRTHILSFSSIKSINKYSEFKKVFLENQAIGLNIDDKVYINLIDELYRYYSRNDSDFNLLLDDKYVFSEKINLTVCDKKKIFIDAFLYNKDNKKGAVAYLNSPVIAEHLVNYYEYLRNSEMCLKKNESIRFVKRIVEKVFVT